jgi:hypothetical protein
MAVRKHNAARGASEEIEQAQTLAAEQAQYRH